MVISRLIEELMKIKSREGDIEVTCTGSLESDGEAIKGKLFETTVENFDVGVSEGIGKRVRLYL